jgi:tetratricopeptide (TPR) repeat protein
MAKTNNEVSEDKFESIESALSKTERYIEENQKSLMIIVGAVIVAVGLYFAFTRWYLKPQEIEAQSQMFIAERNFESDSFNIALNGTSGYPGFLGIIDEYGLTKTANLAHLYAGLCYKNTGKFEDAIEYLKKFDSNDKILSNIALGSIGDCYANIGEIDDAVKYYKRAAKNVKNDFTSPEYLMRAGILLEQNQRYEDALELYVTVKEKYPNYKGFSNNENPYSQQQYSQNDFNIEKYITRVKVKGNIK